MVKAKPDHHWFRSVKLPPIDGRVRRMAAYYRKHEPKPSRKAPMPIRLSMIYAKGRGKIVRLGSERAVRCYTIPDMAKLFNRTIATVRNWYLNGYLPPPFVTRMVGGSPAPLWAASQIAVLARVMNDILSQGYRTIPWRQCPEHLAMIQEGSRRAVARLLNRTADLQQIERRKLAKANFGVEFLGEK